MEDRARVPVGKPVANPTASYWQDPPDAIADLRSTDTLPEDVQDLVIVGSGISGACIAHFLLQRRPDAKVLMLEARQACSGATGRNGEFVQFLTLPDAAVGRVSMCKYLWRRSA